jgi:tRNA modification GTPase
MHGAFDREVDRILGLLDTDPAAARGQLGELARWAPVGRHLVEPWRVVVAGPPNVGKSSLVNALAGYQRAVVSDVAGTTRDVVTVQVAFDGWPVELTDTAGLREAEGLEAEGVERARRVLAEADLVVWLIDGTEPRTRWPEWGTDVPEDRTVLLVQSKADLPVHPTQDLAIQDTTPVSAVTGEGIAALMAVIVKQLIPEPPPPGAGVPYTPGLVELVLGANKALEGGQVEEARWLLGECLARPG